MDFYEVVEKYLPFKKEDGEWKLILNDFFNDDIQSITIPEKLMSQLSRQFELAVPFDKDSCVIEQENTYEVGLKRERIGRYSGPRMMYRSMYYEGNSVEDNDSEHVIAYNIGSPSPKYVFSVFKTLIKNGDNNGERYFNRVFNKSFRRSHIVSILLEPYVEKAENENQIRYELRQDSQKIQEILSDHIDDVLEKAIGLILFPIVSLKITIKQGNVRSSFQQLSSAFLFTRSLSGYPIVQTAGSLESLLFTDRIHELRRRPQPLEAPRRIYHPELVDMYLAAEGTEDSFGAFLGYYHILEFFFDSVFKETIGKKLQNEITNPNFSYTNLDNVYSLGKKASKLIQISRQGDARNELASLGFVLEKYLDQKDIDDIIISIRRVLGEQGDLIFSSGSPRFIKNTKVIFSSPTEFAKTASKRIYLVRNSLVHSKSELLRYRNKRDYKEVKNELYFLKFVAERVLINSSSVLS